MALPVYDTISGIVEATNPKGVKINGAWANFSKFAEDVVPPMRGEHVTLTLDRSGFIRRVDSSEAPMASAAPQHAPLDSSLARGELRASSAQRERTITRLAVLKAAAEFGAARPNLKSGDVLSIAASWEKWIYRDQEITYDLTDAF